MICPLSLEIDRLQKIPDYASGCWRNDCMWYDENKKQCCIREIPKQLARIAEGLRK